MTELLINKLATSQACKPCRDHPCCERYRQSWLRTLAEIRAL